MLENAVSEPDDNWYISDYATWGSRMGGHDNSLLRRDVFFSDYGMSVPYVVSPLRLVNKAQSSAIRLSLWQAAASPENASLALQNEGYLIARSRNRLGMSESRLLSEYYRWVNEPLVPKGTYMFEPGSEHRSFSRLQVGRYPRRQRSLGVQDFCADFPGPSKREKHDVSLTRDSSRQVLLLQRE